MKARTGLLVVVLAALTCVPAISVQAGVGNGGSTVPPGLLVAQQKTYDAFTRQIEREEARYDAKVAPLLLELDAALFAGDLDLAVLIQVEIDELTAKHDAKIARLELKRAEKWLKFDDKMAAFLLKHAAEEEGESEEETPPPTE